MLPVVDTIKAVDANGVVLGTPERAGLRAVQTPQGFADRAAAPRLRAGGRCGASPMTPRWSRTSGRPVHTVAGDPLAFKITTPLDLRLAQAVLES